MCVNNIQKAFLFKPVWAVEGFNLTTAFIYVSQLSFFF